MTIMFLRHVSKCKILRRTSFSSFLLVKMGILLAELSESSKNPIKYVPKCYLEYSERKTINNNKTTTKNSAGAR